MNERNIWEKPKRHKTRKDQHVKVEKKKRPKKRSKGKGN
jgi:hypothetical protein